MSIIEFIKSLFVEINYIYVSELREFKSESELKTWLNNDRTNYETYITDVFDCEDFAIRLQKEASIDGYLLSCQLIFDENNKPYHVINAAYITTENKIIFIEPQNDKEWYISNMD